jgi:hypothetical protein
MCIHYYCSNDTITLHHSEFNQSGWSFNQSCGGIIGRAISVVNGSYTSQLIINVSQNFIGVIECASGS